MVWYGWVILGSIVTFSIMFLIWWFFIRKRYEEQYERIDFLDSECKRLQVEKQIEVKKKNEIKSILLDVENELKKLKKIRNNSLDKLDEKYENEYNNLVDNESDLLNRLDKILNRK